MASSFRLLPPSTFIKRPIQFSCRSKHSIGKATKKTTTKQQQTSTTTKAPPLPLVVSAPTTELEICDFDLDFPSSRMEIQSPTSSSAKPTPHSSMPAPKIPFSNRVFSLLGEPWPSSRSTATTGATTTATTPTPTPRCATTSTTTTTTPIVTTKPRKNYASSWRRVVAGGMKQPTSPTQPLSLTMTRRADFLKGLGPPGNGDDLAAAIARTSDALTRTLLNKDSQGSSATTTATTTTTYNSNNAWSSTSNDSNDDDDDEEDSDGERLKAKRDRYDESGLQYGRKHPRTLAAARNLAHELHRKGEMMAAERILRDTLKIQRKTIGENHPSTLESAGMLANTLRAQGNYAEAITLFQETIAAQKRILGPTHPHVVFLSSHLAAITDQFETKLV